MTGFAIFLSEISGFPIYFAEISGFVLFSSDISGFENLFRSPIFLYFASETSGFFEFSSDISRFSLFLIFRNFTSSCSPLFHFAVKSAAGARSQLATEEKKDEARYSK